MNVVSQKNAYCIFWSVAILHFLVWTFVPGIVQPGHRLDVVELIFIGKEWVLQTNKHPQFPAWLNEIVYQATGGAHFAPFLASQLCVLACLFSIWRVARDLLKSEIMALVAVCVPLSGYWYFNYETTQFNANTVLMAWWSVATALLYFTLKTNKTCYWIATGFAIACGFYAKYTMVFWVIAVLTFLIADGNGRKYWRGIGPYLTTAIAFTLFLPHLIWLVSNDFPCIRYIDDAIQQTDPRKRFTIPLLFIGEQIGYMLPLFIFLLPIIGIRPRLRKIPDVGDIFNRRLLCFLLFIPFVLHEVIAIVLVRNIAKNYGEHFWPFLPLFILFVFLTPGGRTDHPPKNGTRQLPKGVRATLTICTVSWLLMIIPVFYQTWCYPYIMGKPLRIHFPGPQLAVHVDRVWHDRFDMPCPYYTGQWWPAGNAANNSVDRPTVHFYYFGMEEEKKPSASWSSDEDVNERGGMVFWEIDGRQSPEYVPGYLFKRFPTAQVEPGVIELPYQTGANISPVRIRIAVVPPKVEREYRRL